MDFDWRIRSHQRSLIPQNDRIDGLPLEFRSVTDRTMRFRSGRSDRIFALATFCVVSTLFLPFLLSPFADSDVSLRANSPEIPDGLGFVTFLAEAEDVSGSGMKDMFGWGGLDLVYRAAESLAPHVQGCRSFWRPETASISKTIRFDVKVNVKRPGFDVTGLLSGHEQQQDAAVCLRDKIESLQISDFSRLRAAPEKSYKLRIGVQSASGADGGAP